MVKAVVFDLNGVFLVSEYLTSRIQEKYGIPVEESMPVLKESLQNTRLNPDIRIFPYWEKLFTSHDIKLSEAEFLSFWFSGESEVPEMVELAKILRSRGIFVYLFSNNFKERTEYYRTKLPEIFENVDRSFFSWETGLVKSDIAAYQNLLSTTKLKPKELLYFDDAEENVELAKSLGIEAVVYKDAASTIKTLKEQGINPS
jgi:HAD superfamily hydrolase (TIGR01509 family)